MLVLPLPCLDHLFLSTFVWPIGIRVQKITKPLNFGNLKFLPVNAARKIASLPVNAARKIASLPVNAARKIASLPVNAARKIASLPVNAARKIVDFLF